MLRTPRFLPHGSPSSTRAFTGLLPVCLTQYAVPFRARSCASGLQHMRLSAIALTFLVLAAPALARSSQPAAVFEAPEPFARYVNDLFGPDPAIQPRSARKANPRRHRRKPAAKAVLKSPPATNPACSNMRYAADFLPHRLAALPTGRLNRPRASVFAVTGTVSAQEFLAITYVNPNTGAVSVHALDAQGNFVSCPPFRPPPEAPLFLAHAQPLVAAPDFAKAEQLPCSE